MDLQQIDLEKLEEPENPHRTTFDNEALVQLADSIRTVGLIEPLVVEPIDGVRYRVRAGHRRLLACRIINLARVPCVIRTEPAEQLDAVQFAENAHREDLNPWDEAVALAKQRQRGGLSLAALARLNSRSYEWVTARLALLDYPQDIATRVRDGSLSLAHAAALAKCTDEEHRKYLTTYTLLSGANARVIDSWVQQWEAQVAAGTTGDTPRPELTDTIQVPIVLLACDACGNPHDSRTMRIARLCVDCDKALHS